MAQNSHSEVVFNLVRLLLAISWLFYALTIHFFSLFGQIFIYSNQCSKCIVSNATHIVFRC